MGRCKKRICMLSYFLSKRSHLHFCTGNINMSATPAALVYATGGAPDLGLVSPEFILIRPKCGLIFTGFFGWFLPSKNPGCSMFCQLAQLIIPHFLPFRDKANQHRKPLEANCVHLLPVLGHVDAASGAPNTQNPIFTLSCSVDENLTDAATAWSSRSYF